MIPEVGLDMVEHAQLLNAVLTRLVTRFDPELFATITPEGALALHNEAKALAGLARDLVSEADTLLIASLDGSRRATVDNKVIEVRRAYKRVWDTPLLLGAAAACLLQGERVEEVDTVLVGLERLARMEWRVTELEKIGVDTDSYCTKELGRATVSVIA